MPSVQGAGPLQKLLPGFVPWALAFNGVATSVGSVFTFAVDKLARS